MDRIAAAGLAAALALTPLAASAQPADSMTRSERIEKRTKGMEKRFERLDVDKDGVLTQEEAQAPLTKAFARMDKDGDGVLSAEEIKGLRAVAEKRLAKRGDDDRPRARKDRFDRADKDGDGKITRDEFLAQGLPWFRRADKDGDGKVTKAEFDALLEKMKSRAASRDGAAPKKASDRAGVGDAGDTDEDAD
ncbi:EF-hand domain-containing protein [Methylopila henanensis]|uniref:EF-hand domain-containing protein n=1 Tax=Methylopila henanensis TaxID=873516 RepID=A0ABW4K6T0_9HYPH